MAQQSSNGETPGATQHKAESSSVTVTSLGYEEDVIELSVMRVFELRINCARTDVPTSVERLLAFLAVHDRPQTRQHVAAHLWMDTMEERASANLRNTVWRARRVLGDHLVTDGSSLALSPDIATDVRRLTSLARTLLRADPNVDPIHTDSTLLLDDLLPDWDEEWILGERERLRQLRVHALEALCSRLSGAHRYGEAIDVCLLAIAADPLRESAQRLLVSAYLAEGNVSQARQQFDLYSELLWEQIGVEPSPEFRALAGARAYS
jgi:DNA-binding SARP family transcriptional activator